MNRFLVVALCAPALFAGGVAPAVACLNTFDEKLLHGTDDQIAEVIAELKQAYASNPTLKNSNDLGVARLLAGKYDDAIKSLRETEKKFPGNAMVAANLGTALELNGEDEEALEWIREGVQRDPKEHYGSEWLHVRILEAKIALKKDPKWLDKNRVLDMDFGPGDLPVAPPALPIEKGGSKEARQLAGQIGYQLFERTKFVKPPDPIVGDLYASMGDVEFAGGLSRVTYSADDNYEEALRYGAPNADLIRRRLARYYANIAAVPPPVAKKVEKAPSRSKGAWIAAASTFTIVLLATGVLLNRRRRFTKP
jgi:tetratricopeptide (TPR) repeat protein